MSKKRTVSFNEETAKKLEEVTVYCEKNFGAANYSKAIKLAIDAFDELFLRAENQNYFERLRELKKIKNGQLSKIATDVKFSVDQLDILIYLVLATYKQQIQEFPLVQSITEKNETKQDELFAEITDRIRKDRAKGQTKKHSMTKGNRR